MGGVIFYYLGARLGISYNVDIIDYILNFNLGSKAILIIPVGIAYFFLYYFSFKAVILHDNVMTPGRSEEAVITDTISEDEKDYKLATNNFDYLAKKLVQLLGGKENIKNLDACITRLRIEVVDPTLVQDEKIRQTGVKGIAKLTDTDLQIVIGSDVQKVKEAMKEYI